MWNKPTKEQLASIPALYGTENTPLKDKPIYLHFFIGQELWKYICQLFIDFDQKHHPKVFNGGIWLNNGFSSSDKLGPWEISFDDCTVIYP